MCVYARAGYLRAGATRTEIASVRLHARFPAPSFPLTITITRPSPLPLPSSSSPLVFAAAATRTYAYARAHARTHTRTRRARLFPRHFRPPLSLTPSFSRRARARSVAVFSAVVAVVAAATPLFLVLFPGLNSGNGASAPLGLTLPSPLPATSRLPAALLRTLVVVVAAVAAFLRRALSLGLNSRDSPHAFALLLLLLLLLR